MCVDCSAHVALLSVCDAALLSTSSLGYSGSPVLYGVLSTVVVSYVCHAPAAA